MAESADATDFDKVTRIRGKQMIDDTGLHVYECSDGRLRAYSPKSRKVVSYPRALMEQILGRPLKLNEQVHHIDGNPLNNSISNLEVVILGEHQRMHSTKYTYADKEMICPWCGQTFVWTAKRQKTFRQNHNRSKPRHAHQILKPFCSAKCAGSYSRQEQLERDIQSECVLNGEVVPSDNPVPTVGLSTGA